MPQTKQQLEKLLAQAEVTPRHQLGQNFLIDLNLMRLLVDAAGLQGNETVLEVGCGTGSMTDILAQRAGAVVAVEIDRELSGIAAEQLAPYRNISLICTDILARKSQINPVVLETLQQGRAHLGGPFLLVANLPYQVASPLIIDLLLGTMAPAGIYVTVQAEVAQRMIASAGTKEYGLLSILMQGTGSVELLRRIKPQAFWPMPNVHSAMVAWRRDEGKCQHIRDMKVLRHVVELLLGHRRKKIRGCLALKGNNEDFAPLLKKVAIDPDARGETLEPEKYIALANLLAQAEYNTDDRGN